MSFTFPTILAFHFSDENLNFGASLKMLLVSAVGQGFAFIWISTMCLHVSKICRKSNPTTTYDFFYKSYNIQTDLLQIQGIWRGLFHVGESSKTFLDWLRPLQTLSCIFASWCLCWELSMENLDCFGVSILIPSGKGMRSVGCLCELLKQYVMPNNFQKNICCVVQRSKVS